MRRFEVGVACGANFTNLAITSDVCRADCGSSAPQLHRFQKRLAPVSLPIWLTPHFCAVSLNT